MNRKTLMMSGLMMSLAAAAASACQPPPAPAPAPAAAAPAAQPGGEAPKAQEIPTCMGPDGKQHTFPLDVYDENADPRQQIAEAIVKAKSEGKRVLAMWGENWCQFCLYLQDIILNDPGCKPIVKSDFVLVKIDLGKNFVKNRDVAESYYVFEWTQRPDGKMMGAPSLCVIDPDTGRTWGTYDPITGQHTGVKGGNDMVAKPMTLSRLFDEKVIKEFLISTRPPAKPASAAMNDAIVSSKRDSKKILAMFTMPSCDDCDRMSEWLGRPTVAAALGNAFVPVKIDTERMIGALPMLQAAAGGKMVIPPYLVVIDEKGAQVSKDAQFTALPKTDEQIEAFVKGLSTAAKIGDADKALLVKSLKDAALVQAGKP